MDKLKVSKDDLEELIFINLLASSYGKENKKLECKSDVNKNKFTYIVTNNAKVILESEDVDLAIDKFNNC